MIVTIILTIPPKRVYSRGINVFVKSATTVLIFLMVIMYKYVSISVYRYENYSSLKKRV